MDSDQTTFITFFSMVFSFVLVAVILCGISECTSKDQALMKASSCFKATQNAQCWGIK